MKTRELVVEFKSTKQGGRGGSLFLFCGPSFQIKKKYLKIIKKNKKKKSKIMKSVPGHLKKLQSRNKEFLFKPSDASKEQAELVCERVFQPIMVSMLNPDVAKRFVCVVLC